MGKAKSRRGASAAAAPESSPPPRQRRRGQNARAATKQNKPPCIPRLELRSVQVKPATPVRPRNSQDPRPKSRILAFAGLDGEWIDVGGHDVSRLGARPRRTRVPGPTLRQDIPRPPLRRLALQTRRHTRQRLRDAQIAFHRAANRVRASAARAVASVIASLDAWIRQPVLWPFRPAQREMLARTLAVLSLAIVAAGWIAAYNMLAPTQSARPPAPPPAQPKPFAGRVVSDALPVFEAPVDAVPMVALPMADGSTIEVPLPVPPPHLRRPPAHRLL